MDPLGPLRIDREERHLSQSVGQCAAGERGRVVFEELGLDADQAGKFAGQIDRDSGRPFAGGLAVREDGIAHVEGHSKAPARCELAGQ